MSKNLSLGKYLTLQQFWNDQGLYVAGLWWRLEPWVLIPSAAIGPEPWNAAMSSRLVASRWALWKNPNRLYQHHQFQVVMKPSPSNIRTLRSLWSSGHQSAGHDIRFVEDNWKCVNLFQLVWRLGSNGWMVWKYSVCRFQQVGGLPLNQWQLRWHGLERLASYIKKWTLSMTLGGLMVLSTAKFSLILSMSEAAHEKRTKARCA